MPRKHPPEFVLTEEERRELESWQRSTTQKVGLVRRSQVVLLRAGGLSLRRIAAPVGLRRRQVEKWILRFRAYRLAGLADRSGRGRKPFFPAAGGLTSGQTGLRTA